MGVVTRHEVIVKVTDSSDGTTLTIRPRENRGDVHPYEIVTATHSGARTELLYVTLAELELLRLGIGNILDAEDFHPTSPDDPWIDREGEGPRDAGTDATAHRHPF